jgi:hypothetical protein
VPAQGLQFPESSSQFGLLFCRLPLSRLGSCYRKSSAGPSFRLCQNGNRVDDVKALAGYIGAPSDLGITNLVLQFRAMPKLKMDRSILEAALVGLGHTLGDVTAKISEIKRMLGRDGGAQTQRTRKPLSTAARARIAAAQRKRWAASKKQQGQTAAPAKQSSPKKRKISPAARKRMADATRKRWAEYRAKKAKA